MSFLTTENLARVSAKHPWRVIGLWLALLGVSGWLVAQFLATALVNEISFSRQLESKDARDIVVKSFGASDKVTETIIVSSPIYSVDKPEFKAAVTDIFTKVTALKDNVASGANYYLAPNPAFVSTGHHMTIIPLTLTGGYNESVDNAKAIRAVLDSLHPSGFQISLTGTGSINADTNKTAEDAFKTAEFFGMPLALIVMLIVFGTVVAALIPLSIGVAAIVVALGLTALLGLYFNFTFYIVNMILMMGLAVGIDYALFIVSRVREERAHGREKIEAIAKAGQTASHAVFFSGMVVLIALSGLMFVPISIFTSLSAGAILVVAMAILATLTLLPAILSLLGDKMNAGKLPFLKSIQTDDDHRGGFWDIVSGAVMRRPVLNVVVTAGILLALLIPASHLKTGAAGIESIPDSLPSIKAYKILEANFDIGVSPPIHIVVDGNASSGDVKTAIDRLKTDLATKPKIFGTPADYTISKNGQQGLLTVPILLDANTQEATKEVKVVRNDMIPSAFDGVDTKVLVGGAAAANLDYFELTDNFRPIVFTFVLALSFILLTIVFRSIVVPVKAILLNLLSVGATYGLLVLVFQDGYGAHLFGFGTVDAIDAWVPLFLFAVLFGLSMDYHVFLLSRIRERFLLTGDNTESVAFGLRNTGRIITGAALIMVSVFAAFAAGKLVMFQQMGFGLGISVLLDATIIRSVLVPASMKLLGKWNWYLPKWLEWIPKVHIEG